MAYCNNVTLKAIPVDCEANVGGIKKVWLALYEDGVFTLDASGETVSAVTLSSGSTWNAFNFRKGSSSMNSTLNVDETNGISYVQTDLAMIFSKMETKKRTAVAALAAAQVVGIVLDANSHYWALGFSEAVAATAGTGETGTARGDANQYTITLTDIAPSYPYEIPASVIEGLNLPE